MMCCDSIIILLLCVYISYVYVCVCPYMPMNRHICFISGDVSGLGEGLSLSFCRSWPPTWVSEDRLRATSET